MKPNFALSLSFDGLRLMHRVPGGWHLVGQVALDDPDLTGALAGLRAAALTLEPGGIATKLLIPNDQIKYLALDTTRAEDADVWAALDGATPYAVTDLVYDYAKGGGRTYVAAAAKETLTEAEAFAAEHGFNPISFAAVPEPFTFVGEAFFGPVEGKTAERDAEPVIVTGSVDIDIPTPVSEEPDPEAPPEPEQDTDATFEPLVPPLPPSDEDPAPEPDAEPEFEPETVQDKSATEPDPSSSEDEPETSADDASVTPEGETDPADSAVEPEEEAPVDEVPPLDADPAADTSDVIAEPATGDIADEADAAEDVDPEETATPEVPQFASLRADRNEGRPAPAEPEQPVFAARRRGEPPLGRATPPPLAVPTGRGTDPMPPVTAPSQVPAPDVVPAPSVSADTPVPDVAPVITGQAATTRPADASLAAVAAASLAIDPDEDDDEVEPAASQTAASAALGAATAVGGAVGGMFASRRMARAEAKSKAAVASGDAKAKPDTTSRTSVFGARKQPKPKAVVGGKPRFLGLILTAILLLFLLAIAALAALSEDGLAAWFGFGTSETQIATPSDNPETTDTSAASEVAALLPPDGDPAATAPDVLATPTAPTGGQVLSPEEATRIYAATGVWQRAPRIPLTPRTTNLDGLSFAPRWQSVPRVPPSPLASASSVAGDALIATPVDPPAPDTTFNFGSDGLVVATPQGTATPDGIIVIAGPPPLNPPTRPGTVAPEVTPQDQLAAVIPDDAVPVADTPEGVVVIIGRPSITPPVRTGTVAPAPTPEAVAIASGVEPLLARDGLLVLAGAPPVLPPARPGTTAPTAPAATPDPVAVTETPASSATATDPQQPEGLNVIAGSPPVLPPVRPGTVAPQNDAAVQTLSNDIAEALSTGTAQTPNADTLRPRPRPAAVVEAAVQAANTPAVGDLTVAEASAFRPRIRPAGLAPPPVPDAAEPQEVAATPAPAPTTGLQLSAEIAAAVEAAANRPNPIVNPTAQAVTVSERPDTRPRNMARIVARAQSEQARVTTQVAAAVPRNVAVAPTGPTAGSVAQAATLENEINLREINLIGIFGGANDRRALVRLSNGRYVRVTVGDRLDGGRVTAISSSALSYTTRGRAVTLEVAG